MVLGPTYQGQRIAQQYESRRMIGQLIGEAGYVRVDVVVDWSDLQGLLIDLVWWGWASASSV